MSVIQLHITTEPLTNRPKNITNPRMSVCITIEICADYTIIMQKHYYTSNNNTNHERCKSFKNLNYCFIGGATFIYFNKHLHNLTNYG